MDMRGNILVLVDKAGMELDLKVLFCIIIPYGAEVTGLDRLSFQKITGKFLVFNTDKTL